jgi:hypothetical protein
MTIWHSINEGVVDDLLAAQVDVYVLQLRLSSIGSSVTQPCAGAWSGTGCVQVYSMKSLCIWWMIVFRVCA